MSPIVQAAIGSIIRFALAAGAGILVRHGIWTDSAATTYIEAGTLGILSLGWSLYEKWQRHELTGTWWRRFGRET